MDFNQIADFREELGELPKKRRGKKGAAAAAALAAASDNSGNSPPSQKSRAGAGAAGATRGGGARRNKKHINKQIIEGMFDFNGPAAISTDDEGSAAVLAPHPHQQHIPGLSKKERAQIESRFSKPKNDSQKKYAQFLNDPSKKIIIATGPAGTGKTLMATEHAIKNFIFGKYEKIMFTRPSVAVDEDLGYLPGTAEEKLSVYVRPIYDILYQHFGVKDTTQMVEEKILEICPIGFMRGRTFKNCCIIADEMQNSTQPQMKMLLTRIGENCRLIITGDLEQTDRRSYEDNGLGDFLAKLSRRRANSISSIEFNRADVEREEVIKEVLDIYGISDNMWTPYAAPAAEEDPAAPNNFV
jgi:phosphate starvation-inducible protein PhoH